MKCKKLESRHWQGLRNERIVFSSKFLIPRLLQNKVKYCGFRPCSKKCFRLMVFWLWKTTSSTISYLVQNELSPNYLCLQTQKWKFCFVFEFESLIWPDMAYYDRKYWSSRFCNVYRILTLDLFDFSNCFIDACVSFCSWLLFIISVSLFLTFYFFLLIIVAGH